MATTFDFETALKQLQSGQALTGENGILTPLIKQLTEAALEAEIENYIEANPKQGNRRNGRPELQGTVGLCGQDGREESPPAQAGVHRRSEGRWPVQCRLENARPGQGPAVEPVHHW